MEEIQYSFALMKWKDEDPELEPRLVMIGIMPDHMEHDFSEDDMDDRIFYYATESELERLLDKDSGEEFYLIELED